MVMDTAVTKYPGVSSAGNGIHLPANSHVDKMLQPNPYCVDVHSQSQAKILHASQ